MNALSADELKSLFDLLERCHTVLADIFPHDGLKSIGGSRVFFHDPLKKTLKNCIMEISKELNNLAVNESGHDIHNLWSEVPKLLTRIERVDLSKINANEINKAATLMYLANGVTWNYLRELISGEPSHNPQYVNIEPLLPLLKMCGWQNEADVDSKKIIQLLPAELKACMAN